MMLSALWVTLMFLYVYADILSFYRPGKMEAAMAGRMGPFPVTQASLLQASILMLIPALMVFLSLALKPGVGRWVNIVLGLLYTAINIGNLVGETWAFYILYGIVEMAITLLIVGYAWKWRNSEG
jgi:cbb3-type cytochrome oxidase subunit 3